MLRTLSHSVAELEAKFSVRTVSLFGPAARGEWRKGADIGVLVEFAGVPTFDRYMDLQLYLESLFGESVALLTIDAVKPRMWPAIERSLIHVA